jgi:hypothetical protein
MAEPEITITGGCLCGALSYAAKGPPIHAGQCYCVDCRKASGGPFIPFMGFAADQVRFTGEAKTFFSKSFRGGESARNFCPECGGLVFGGVIGETDSFTIYAGSLDDPSAFKPAMAIFNRDRPPWSPLPAGLAVFETMPSG